MKLLQDRVGVLVPFAPVERGFAQVLQLFDDVLELVKQLRLFLVVCAG